MTTKIFSILQDKCILIIKFQNKNSYLDKVKSQNNFTHCKLIPIMITITITQQIIY